MMERISLKGLLAGVVVAILVNLSLFSLIPGMAEKKLPGRIASHRNRVTLEYLQPPPQEPDLPEEEPKEEPPPPEKPDTRAPMAIPDVAPPMIALELPVPALELASDVPVAAPVAPVAATGPVTSGPAPAPAFSGPLGEEQLDKPPIPRYKSPPLYPYRARRMNISGKVTVRFLVSPDGSVSDITIVESDPPGVFDANVLRAVRKWEFAPGELMGEKVAVRVVRTIEFKLNG